jgi:ubiquinone/menaquinone biosynthesis C-methylase UbiE
MLIGSLAGCHAIDEDFEPIARHLALEPGATVADIGTGEGDFLPFYSRLVGVDGRVYGTEIDPGLIDGLRDRVVNEELTNVRIHEAGTDTTGLPDGCCDAVVLRHVYHHLTEPATVLADIQRSLKPGGRLLVIDFRPTVLLAPWTPEDLPEDRSGHGVTPELIVREAEAAGFTSLGVEESWAGSHMLMDRFAVVLEAAGR